MNRRFLIAGCLGIAALVGLWQLSTSRTFQVAGKIVARVVCSDKIVALTFDDGPVQKYAEEVLAVLGNYRVKATFFLTGREIDGNPGAAAMIASAGHELGNHSYSHPRLVCKFPSTIRDELEKTDAAIRRAGYQGTINFRPPYGKKLFILPWQLAKMGKTTIMWDIEPESFAKTAENAELIKQHILQKVQPGSIILLHVMYESRAETRKALPMIIEELLRLGYRFVTVSELLSKAES